ncbi:tyrosine-type recombinase/integrase [Clostridium ganghwense]|uniref:Tyrosine-type recombinase/integrase n=1 Tax=Clostridium ganghwense TaxID=312089 RepID=A0ABT4CU34_9CLOT|nr:tyrosine-type recombinase/integrase [Clostridium ganghwense]MCY6372564.1 tyrosine-type recombinase/integrase [Clostridium ganghwense]
MGEYLVKFSIFLARNNKSDKTIDSYLRDIKQFIQYLKQNKKELNRLHNTDVENFKNHLIYDKNLNIKTVNRKLVSLNQFFKFNNIAVDVKQEKVQAQNFLDDMLSNHDVERMIKAAYKKDDIRASAIIYTLYYTGMRVSEMLQLTIHDINKDSIGIIGKGSKHREVFIPDRLREIWNSYIQVRIKKGTTLFTGIRGPINRQTVHNTIKYYAGQAKIKKSKAHAHNFRHLYCKNLADKGIDISTIADIAGHHNINTTRIYTRKTKKELINIINDI